MQLFHVSGTSFLDVHGSQRAHSDSLSPSVATHIFVDNILPGSKADVTHRDDPRESRDFTNELRAVEGDCNNAEVVNL